MRDALSLLYSVLGLLFALISPLAHAVSIDYAENFSLQVKGSTRILSIFNAGYEQTYALLPHGAPLTKEASGLPIIRTPVSKIVILETVYVGFLDTLNSLDAIHAAASIEYISNQEFRTMLELGEVTPIKGGQAIDAERLLLLQPDLILSSIALNLPAQIQRSNLPILLTASYTEASPLGRAEWIKCFGALLGKETEANTHFQNVAEKYNRLKQLVSEIQHSERPSVFCDAPYRGTWHVPGGNSYTAQLISDAGGQYVWADDGHRASIPLDTERVFLKAAEADIWINPSHYRSLSQIKAADSRFTLFQAFKNGRVYNNTRQLGHSAGNPIWEKGVPRPDLILADLVFIFHPEVLPNHQFEFYEKLH